MTRPRPLPAELGSSFASAHALAIGVTPRRLRAKDLSAPFRGTRRKRKPDDEPSTTDDETHTRYRHEREEHRESMHLFATVMEPGAFFCGSTAAYAYGAPIDRPERLHVGVFAPRRAPRRRGIRGRKVEPRLATVRDHDGLPMSSPASTWAMLGQDLSVRELVKIGDAFVQIPRDDFGRRHPELALATIDQLRAATEAGMRPGVRRLRRALELIRVGSSSPMETEFRLDADAAGLPVPVLDREIRDEGGRLLGISEFAYPEFLTVVEIEGDHHRTSRQQWDRDIAKYQSYADAGWHPVRLTSRHVRGEKTGVSIVAATLRRRGWDGAPPAR